MAFNYEQQLSKLLEIVARQQASDLHLSVGGPPTIRVDGHLTHVPKYDTLTPEDTEGLARVIVDGERDVVLEKDIELDFSYEFKDKARFRVNVFHQSGFVSVAMRLIPAKILSIEDLKLPSILHTFTKATQGFFLVVGPSGHGKSTTLAAIIDEINRTRSEHIITIEDPIEYLFTQEKSIIDQREVGRDTKDFHSALRSAFRQDPDVIMVGEMRDPETISAAITAAETGHLVLSTLHTQNAPQTIERIVDIYPGRQQNQIRTMLSNTLHTVVSQVLFKRSDVSGMIPA